MIDHLSKRFAGEDSKVVYVYFDYKARQTQTVDYIARNLLKQLVSQSADITTDLQSLFDKYIKYNTKPDTTTLVELLTSFAKTFHIYAVFDAMDECSDDHKETILSFFADLEKSGIRLFISTRPHLVENVQDRLKSIQMLIVSAHESDVQNYVKVKLKKERNKNTALEIECLKLATGVEGMYTQRISNSG